MRSPPRALATFAHASFCSPRRAGESESEQEQNDDDAGGPLFSSTLMSTQHLNRTLNALEAQHHDAATLVV